MNPKIKKNSSKSALKKFMNEIKKLNIDGE